MSKTPADGYAYIVTRVVEPDHDAQYRAWCGKVFHQIIDAAGFLGNDDIPPVEGTRDFWTHVTRFESRKLADAWVASSVLQDLLVDIEPYASEFDKGGVRTDSTGWVTFGFDPPSGQAPPAKWKQYAAALTALYPTVTLISTYITGPLDMAAAPTTLSTNALAMALVLFVWMPLLSRGLHGWLTPPTPPRPATQVGVPLGLLAVIGVFFLVFSLWI